MISNFPKETGAEKKFELVKNSSVVQGIKKEIVDAAAEDLLELVTCLSADEKNKVGLTDSEMIETLQTYGHSYDAIRAAEARLVNSKRIIGQIVAKEDPKNFRGILDGTKKYFLNDNYTGEKNGEDTHKR